LWVATVFSELSEEVVSLATGVSASAWLGRFVSVAWGFPVAVVALALWERIMPVALIEIANLIMAAERRTRRYPSLGANESSNDLTHNAKVSSGGSVKHEGIGVTFCVNTSFKKNLLVCE
jgi:hypothetical protein